MHRERPNNQPPNLIPLEELPLQTPIPNPAKLPNTVQELNDAVRSLSRLHQPPHAPTRERSAAAPAILRAHRRLPSATEQSSARGLCFAFASILARASLRLQPMSPFTATWPPPHSRSFPSHPPSPLFGLETLRFGSPSVGRSPESEVWARMRTRQRRTWARHSRRHGNSWSAPCSHPLLASHTSSATPSPSRYVLPSFRSLCDVFLLVWCL
jgi:hypothetical protein